MGSHPINLFVRFLLEISALISQGYWAWHYFNSPVNYILAFVIPAVFMAMWVIFAVPNDPSRSGKAPVAVPGIIRLIFELLFFGTAAWALYNSGQYILCLILSIITFVHYVISYDRIIWLISVHKQNDNTIQ